MNDTIAIIDYGMGNLRSVQKAFEKIGVKATITNDKKEIQNASKIILPGVGAFKDAMANLNELELISILNEEVLEKKKPFLGICLGMQLVAKTSEEFGLTNGLGWIDAKIVRFPKSELKVPHVGWNDINFTKESLLFENIPNNKDFYFVHSYYFDNQDKECVIATCKYGIDFTCSIQKENIFSTQFHPEKSQTYGLQILKNFASLKKDTFC